MSFDLVSLIDRFASRASEPPEGEGLLVYLLLSIARV